MEEWVKWGIGLAFAGLTTMVGYMVNSHRSLAAKQSDDVRSLHAKIDDVKDKYVRRDDFATFRQETRDALKGIDEKLDRVIAQTKH